MTWEYRTEYAKLLDKLNKDTKPWIPVSQTPVPVDGSKAYFKLSEDWKGEIQFDVGYWDDYTTRWWYDLTEDSLEGEFDTEFGNLGYEILAWKYVEDKE